MQYGNAAWGFRETPIEDQFKMTAGMGLSILEIGIANAPNDIPLNVTADRLDEIRRLSEKYKIKILAGATGNDFTIGRNDISKVKRVIDICRELEIQYLRIFAGFTALEDVSEEVFNDMIKSLTEVCEYAGKAGVTPAIETHGGVNEFDDGVQHFMSTTTDLETLKKILRALPDNAKLCYDPANLYAVGIKNPEHFYNEIKSKVAYAHFKDFASLPSGHLKPSYCGDSDMDWGAILNAMKGVEGFALFEYENTDDIEEGLVKSYNYIIERNIENE